MQHVPGRLARALAAAAGALLLSACADGIELNGKLFDAVGISSAALDAKKSEPKLAERAPLVLPPDVNRLPEPGSGKAPVVQQAAWPDDPEQRKIRQAQERERLHLAYCRGDIQWKDKAFDKEGAGAAAPRSPYGPCPTLFGSSITSNVETNINKR
jgi:hypothetical protein